MRERLPPCAPEAATPARGRLPTETEWEFAARHPHIGWVETPKLYPWGDEAPSNETEWRLNLWQGDFPSTDAALDGHAGLAPADRLRALTRTLTLALTLNLALTLALALTLTLALTLAPALALTLALIPTLTLALP